MQSGIIIQGTTRYGRQLLSKMRFNYVACHVYPHAAMAGFLIITGPFSAECADTITCSDQYTYVYQCTHYLWWLTDRITSARDRSCGDGDQSTKRRTVLPVIATSSSPSSLSSSRSTSSPEDVVQTLDLNYVDSLAPLLEPLPASSRCSVRLMLRDRDEKIARLKSQNETWRDDVQRLAAAKIIDIMKFCQIFLRLNCTCDISVVSMRVQMHWGGTFNKKNHSNNKLNDELRNVI